MYNFFKSYDLYLGVIKMFFKKNKPENNIEIKSETVQNSAASTTKSDNSDLLLNALHEVKGNVGK